MGGSGGTFSNYKPSEMVQKVRDEERKIDNSEFETRLAGRFTDLLSRFNDRDAGLARERLEKLTTSLGPEIAEKVDLVFGGSVAKHTYVDGLSDVDSILILNDTPLADRTPQKILERLAADLSDKLEKGSRLSVGSIAITVEYSDGMTLQLLPGLRGEGHLKVPAWRRNEWSAINPEQFKAGLTKRNEECGGKVVPTIKLVKAINATLPEKAQLTGYHIESLAIAAFRGYEGPKTTVKMLPHFFERAADLVLHPMNDRTGQSVHVDDHLGPANSDIRKELGYVLQRISKRMTNATAAQSVEQWSALFGEA